MFSLHHVPQTCICKSLGKVGIRCHEAIMIEARSKAGRAQTKGLALRAARVRGGPVVLRGQVSPKQGLKQLREKE